MKMVTLEKNLKMLIINVVEMSMGMNAVVMIMRAVA